MVEVEWVNKNGSVNHKNAHKGGAASTAARTLQSKCWESWERPSGGVRWVGGWWQMLR